MYYGYADLYDADASVLCRELGFSYGLMLNTYAQEFPWTYDQDVPPFVTVSMPYVDSPGEDWQGGGRAARLCSMHAHVPGIALS
mgnify:CR=1 FL=1